MKIIVLIIFLFSFALSQKLNETRIMNGQVMKWTGRSWVAVVAIPKSDSIVTKLIAGSNVTVQRQGESGAWKVSATGGGSGSTDTTSLSNRIDAKQNIIPNLADTAKYLEKSDTTYLLAGKLAGKQATIPNLADTSKYVEGSDTTNRWAPKGTYQGAIPNLADTSKYLEKYIRNNGDTTFLSIAGGSDTVRFYVDSLGLVRVPHIGVRSYTEQVDDFLSGSVTGTLNWTATNSSGSHATTNGDTTTWGVIQGTTGANATGRSFQSLGVTSLAGGYGTAVFEARVKVDQLQSNGTGNCFKVSVGFGDVFTGAISTDGVWFQYDSISAGKWVAYTKSGANLDSAGVGSAISTSAWYTLRAEIDGYKQSTLPTVRFYIDNVLVRTVFSATRVPVGSALFGAMAGIAKFTGSNATAKTYRLDYFYLSKRYGYKNPVQNR
jgi:hypothetical protein